MSGHFSVLYHCEWTVCRISQMTVFTDDCIQGWWGRGGKKKIPGVLVHCSAPPPPFAPNLKFVYTHLNTRVDVHWGHSTDSRGVTHELLFSVSNVLTVKPIATSTPTQAPPTLCRRNLKMEVENASNVFRPIRPEEFKNVAIADFFGFVFEKNSNTYPASSGSKSTVFKMFLVHTRTKSKRVLRYLWFKKRFRKAPFFFFLTD